MVGDFKVKASPTQLSLDTSLVITNVELVNVHHLIKRLFSKEMLTKAVGIPPAGRINHFLVNWQKLTLNQNILSVVKGYRIRFIKILSQRKISKFYKDEQEANCSCGFGIKGDVEERGNNESSTCPRAVSEQLIPCGKKDGVYHPVINLKMLNQFITFLHFKMEGLFQLNHIIQGQDWMCKLNLKDEYFSVPLDQNSRKFVRFQWKETLYEFMCLCFGLGPALRVFTKLLKIPISEKDQYQSDNIFGRYIDFESHNTTGSHEPRLRHISPAKCGLYNKHKESNFALMSENRNSGNGDRFNQNDFVIDTRKLKVQKVVKICQDLLRRVILRLFWT